MPINGFLLEKQRMITGTKNVTSELQAGTADHAPYFSLATSFFPHRKADKSSVVLSQGPSLPSCSQIHTDFIDFIILSRTLAYE